VRPDCDLVKVVLRCRRYYAFGDLKIMPDTTSHTEPKPASAPAGQAVVPAVPATDPVSLERPAPDPTRYGDWEKNGRCIDF